MNLGNFISQRARRNARTPWRLNSKLKIPIPILCVLTWHQVVAGLTTPAATPATPLLCSRNLMIIEGPGSIVGALGAFLELILVDLN